MAELFNDTVWPWLLGFWVEAAVRARGSAPRNLLAAFEAHLLDAGVGQVSEVFSAEPPHEPGGTIAQAWSVAELLRAGQLLQESGTS